MSTRSVHGVACHTGAGLLELPQSQVDRRRCWIVEQRDSTCRFLELADVDDGFGVGLASTVSASTINAGRSWLGSCGWRPTAGDVDVRRTSGSETASERINSSVMHQRALVTMFH